MGCRMKTSLVLDDSVMARLKREAIRQGRMICDLVEIADREVPYQAMEGRMSAPRALDRPGLGISGRALAAHLVLASLLQSPVQGKSGESKMLGRETLVVLREPQDLRNDRALDVRQILFPQQHLYSQDRLVARGHGHSRPPRRLPQFTRKAIHGEGLPMTQDQ